MTRIISFIKHSSLNYVYITSFFLISNFNYQICDNLLSIAFLLILSIICAKILSQKAIEYVASKKFILPLLGFILFFTSVYEVKEILKVFEFNSDYKNTVVGKYIFALCIIFVSFLIAFCRRNAVMALSWILLVLQLFLFISVVPAVVKNGISFEMNSLIYTDDPVYDLSCGLFCFLLSFADSFIINIMQVREKCYDKKNSADGLVFANITFGVLFIIFYSLFGHNILRKLDSPLISSLGAIGSLNFEEIALIIYSVCMLYRFAIKLKFILSEIHSCSATPVGVVFSVFTALTGALIFNLGINDNVITSLIGMLCFIFYLIYSLCIIIFIFRNRYHKTTK